MNFKAGLAVKLIASALVLLGASCGGGSSSTPPPPPPPPPVTAPTISAFTATPATLALGSSTTLTWKVSAATTLSIDQGVGAVTGASVIVNPVASVTYTLTATNSGGSVTKATAVTVGTPPQIASFIAKPSFVTTGQSSTLSWSVSGATSVTLNDFGALSGTSALVNPAADTRYLLTASNAFGSAEASLDLAVFAPPKTWFAPLANLSEPNYGVVDYTSLFTPDAPWPNAAAHVNVFKLYAQMLSLPDAALMNLFADLKRRHIAVGLEWGALVPDNCGLGVEGFDGANALAYATRIHALGGSLNYIAFDEPYSFAAIYTGPSACNWTAEQIAQNAAAQVAVVRSVFPDVRVGDIEVVPSWNPSSDWLVGYQAWIDAWQRVTGEPLAFFHFDTDLSSDWRPGTAAMQQVLAQRSIPFGVIYNAAGGAQTSDADWVNSAEQHFQDYENRGSPLPNQIIFQSWNPYPHHLLPETDPTTFTALIDNYFRDRSGLTAMPTATQVQGYLTDAATGRGIAAAPVKATAVPYTGLGLWTAYNASGIVPAGTVQVVFGARVGIECDSSPPSDFYLGAFSLVAGDSLSIGLDFTNGLNGWGTWLDDQLTQIEGTYLHVRVNQGQSFGLNSYSIPFNAAGLPFNATINAMVPAGAQGNACLIAVFLNANNEGGRVSLPLQLQPLDLGTAYTAADGSYALAFPAPLAGNYELWTDYAGTSTLWPAAAGGEGGALPFTIATAALHAGTVGFNYAQTLATMGGHGPFLCLAENLPPGLTLHFDGTLSGTPTASGTTTMTVSVFDNSVPTRSAVRALTVTIN